MDPLVRQFCDFVQEEVDNMVEVVDTLELQEMELTRKLKQVREELLAAKTRQIAWDIRGICENKYGEEENFQGTVYVLGVQHRNRSEGQIQVSLDVPTPRIKDVAGLKQWLNGVEGLDWELSEQETNYKVLSASHQTTPKRNTFSRYGL